MVQRVTRSQTITHTIAEEFRAQRTAEAAAAPDPADVGALTAIYGQLFEMVNDSPPLVRAGDQQLLALTRVWCGPCRRASRRRGKPVAVVKAIDARPRGGPIIFVLQTQHPGPASGDPWRQAPVVLGAPGDDLGRVETPCPKSALTWCRAHGPLVVKIDSLLYETRRALQQVIAGGRGRQGSVIARPA
jgi:hypothetical protein